MPFVALPSLLNQALSPTLPFAALVLKQAKCTKLRTS